MPYRYAIVAGLLVLLAGCTPEPSATPMSSEPVPPPSPASDTIDTSARPPAAATGLADRLRPLAPAMDGSSDDLANSSATSPSPDFQRDTGSAIVSPFPTQPPRHETIDPFTGVLLDAVLLPDLLSNLTDSLVFDTTEPVSSLVRRPFLEQACRNQGIGYLICRQRYGS